MYALKHIYLVTAVCMKLKFATGSLSKPLYETFAGPTNTNSSHTHMYMCMAPPHTVFYTRV